MFYGRVILVLSTINVAVEGAVKQLFPVLLVVFVSTFGWSNAATAAVFGVGGLAGGLVSPLMGTLLDRLGPRVVFPLGGLLLGIGFLALSGVSHLWQLFLIYPLFVAVGENIVSAYLNAANLSNWFHRKRGQVIGIADAGTGLGILLFVPLAQILIMEIGWREALQWLALVFSLIVIIPNAVLQRRLPQDVGQYPDGELNPTERSTQPATEAHQKQDSQGLSFRNVVTSGALWSLFFGRMFSSAADYLVTVHRIAFLIAIGYTGLTAASTIGFIGVVSIGSRPLAGILSDRIGREWTVTLSQAFWAIGLISVAVLGDGSQLWPLVVFVILLGLSGGPIGIAISAKTADLFAGQASGRAQGMINLGRGLGIGMGPWIGGMLVDATGGYILAFTLAGAFAVASGTFIWIARHQGVTLLRKRGVVASASSD